MKRIHKKQRKYWKIRIFWNIQQIQWRVDKLSLLCSKMLNPPTQLLFKHNVLLTPRVGTKECPTQTRSAMFVVANFPWRCLNIHHKLQAPFSAFCLKYFPSSCPHVLSLVFLRSQLNCHSTVFPNQSMINLHSRRPMYQLPPTHSYFPTVNFLGHFSSLSQKKGLTYVGHWEKIFTLATSWCIGEFMKEKANSTSWIFQGPNNLLQRNITNDWRNFYKIPPPKLPITS